jgi:hypothetical protein
LISKPEDHEINREGKRLLREAVEPPPLRWVVNDVQEDYGIDCNIQVFAGNSPTGAWFHLQLKSSRSSAYAADGTFVSQELSVDHARHYSLEMREPVLVAHADVTSKRLYWYSPQLDRDLMAALGGTDAKSVTVRIPSSQLLPATAPNLLATLDRIYLTLANRELTSSSIRSFAASLRHLPDQAALHQAFQEKNDTLKLRKIHELSQQRRFDEARPRAKLILDDPDSTIEVKFWTEIVLWAIDRTQTVHAGKPQSELPKLALAHAMALQKLTKAGPKHLKFYSLIARHSAELEILVQQSAGVFMALHQHLEQRGSPMMALHLYSQRVVLTKAIVSKYNRCLRLVRLAANYPDRWALGRAVTTVVNAIGGYLITLRYERNFEAEQAFANSALQVCKLAAWICNETGDPEGIVLAIISSLLTTHATDSDAYRWAHQTAENLQVPLVRADALLVIERAVKRWKGERVEGDYHGDTIWQIVQNMATSLGIDLSNENDPLVRSLRIAAKDNSPERILAQCEHLLVALGATGPNARKVQRLFNVGTAGSKVIHCTLHGYHKEAREQDVAHEEFKRSYCDSCPDKKPRPTGWRYTGDVRREIEARNYEFLARLAGTDRGLRFTDED